MLIELHIIQNHAPSNLNRDDTGSPKSCVFGGYRRARISSQCLKRTIRQSEQFKNAMEKIGLSYRTIKYPKLVTEALIAKGVKTEIAQEAGMILSKTGQSAKTQKKSKEDDEIAEVSDKGLVTKQIMFVTQQELDKIVDVLKSFIDKAGSLSAFQKIKPEEITNKLISEKITSVTPDMSLFGRMITSDIFEDVEASIQVAHAISTNKYEVEFDFFTAVDDLKQSKEMEEAGASMIGDVEYNSACYYKYFSFDTDNFLDNLGFKDHASKDAKEMVSLTINALLESIVKNTPTGKQNTFAAFNLPDAILMEIRPEHIPVSYANAFLNPIRASFNKDLSEASIEALIEEAEKITTAYGLPLSNRLWFNTKGISMPNAENFAKLDELSGKLKKIVEG